MGATHVALEERTVQGQYAVSLDVQYDKLTSEPYSAPARGKPSLQKSKDRGSAGDERAGDQESDLLGAVRDTLGDRHARAREAGSRQRSTVRGLDDAAQKRPVEQDDRAGRSKGCALDVPGE